MRVALLPGQAREETSLDREVRELSMAVRGARVIATHIRPDLDALLAVWVCERVRRQDGKKTEILFLPANTSLLHPDVLAVDIGQLEQKPDNQYERQFIKGLHKFSYGMAIKMSSVEGSASMALLRLLPPEEKNIMAALARSISEADSNRNIHDIVFDVSEFREDINRKNEIKCSTIWHTHRCLSAVLSDHELYNWWSHMFEGEIIKGLERHKARKQAIDITYLLNGKLAVMPFGALYQASSIAFKRGAQVALFSRRIATSNRWCLGLVRDNQMPVDLSSIFSGHLTDFPSPFVHPDGFLVGWVTKSPLICTEEEFQKVRSRFVDRAVELLTRFWTKS